MSQAESPAEDPHLAHGQEAVSGGVPRERVEAWIVAAVLVVLLVAGAASEFTRERQSVGVAATPLASVASQPASGPPSVGQPPLLERSLSVLSALGTPFPVGVKADVLGTVVSDDVQESNVWSVRSRPRRVLLRRLLPASGALVRYPRTKVPAAVDVAIYDSAVGAAAFLVDARAGGALDVDVRRTSGAGQRVRRFRTAVVNRPAGSQRTIQVGRWGGSRADLFVVDRGLRNRAMRVRVLSGESDFRSTVLDVVVPFGAGFANKRWSLDLQDLNGAGRSDIVLTTRTADTGSGRVEVHVLSSRTRFASFLRQAATGQRASRARGQQAVSLRRGGELLSLLVDGRTATATARYLG